MKKKRRKIFFPMIKREWSALRQNWWLKLVLLVIIFIPIIYTGVFLGSMWDPYGNTNEIPVAVVNHDKAVEFNDKKLDVGKELVDNLMDNDAMKFEVADENKANEGLKKGDYYMIINIPEDFSKNATTLLDDKPKEMVIEYTTNPGKNYIASKMDETAINKIKNSVSASVTETYARTLFDSIDIMSEGYSKAADGSKKLSQGTVKLAEGNSTISSNLNVLASSSLTFKDGVSKLEGGLNKYTAGVSQVDKGAGQLKGGINTLASKTGELSKGVSQLKDGSGTLKAGVSEYTGGVSEAKKGIDKLANSSRELKSGASSLSKGLNSAALLTNGINAQVKGMPDQIDKLIVGVINNDKLPNEVKIKIINESLVTLKGQLTAQSQDPTKMGLIQAMGVLNDGVGKAKAGSQALEQGINNYTAGVGQLQAGINEIDKNSAALVEGAGQLDSGIAQLKGNTPALASGVKALNSGATALKDGTSKLKSNSGALLSGASQLKDGSQKISDGAGKLAAGSSQLGGGIAQLQAGANTLNKALIKGAKESNLKSDDETYKMMAEPVKTSDKEISVVKNNGSAMAPYMMSVALYVAAMAFTLMYPLLKHIQKAKSGLRYWAGKASVMYPVAIGAAVIMVGLLMAVNGLEPQQVGMTFVFAILVSMAFMSMIVFFNAAFGRVGEFLMLIYMVINLGGSAGTYPLETSAPWFKTIHPFVPFTYSVDGFRNVILMDDPSAIAGDIKLFILVIISFAVATILYYSYRRKHPKPMLEEAFPAE